MKKQFLLFYIALWFILLVLFWCTNMDEMLYSITAFYVGLPLGLLMISIFGVSEMNIKTHILFVVLALSYMLCEYLTYSLSNMITFSKINMPEIAMFITALAILYIGVTIRNLITGK